MRASFHQTLQASPGMIVYGKHLLFPQKERDPTTILSSKQSTQKQVTKDLQCVNKKRVTFNYNKGDKIFVRLEDR